MAALEKELGFAQNTIQKWDRTSPSAERVKKVADRFGVSIDYLMTGEEPQKEKPQEVDPLVAMLMDVYNDLSAEDQMVILRQALAFREARKQSE
ncbi:MAG: helix-turn-helix transcriptional regulator [Selenomonadales bacterium]|nr:helix-turn-helix transcriptional regulator [Selenomonadales bacterium]